MKVLITSGATREPIDRVRFITNISSGATGAKLAEEFSERHEVTYLHGEGAVLPKPQIEKLKFTDFTDLNKKIQSLVADKNFDVVIHLAAVSDYSVESVVQNGNTLKVKEIGKLESGLPLEVKLAPNFKILSRVKGYATNEPMVVGFKLTYNESPNDQAAAIEKIFKAGGVDLVVHNDLKEIEAGKDHNFYVYNMTKKLKTCSGPQDLAQTLNQIIEEVL